MTYKPVAGEVLTDGYSVGTVQGNYIDESADRSSEQYASRTIQIAVYADGVEVGSGSWSYTDKIAKWEGGVESCNITGSVYVNQVLAGVVSGVFEDEYGAVTAISTPQLQELIELVMLLVFLFIIVSILQLTRGD